MSARRRLLLSLLIPVAFLIVGLSIRNDFGETWDEQFDQDIGRFYVHDWPTKGLAGLEQRFMSSQRNYGPFFDVVIERAHLLLKDKLKLEKDTRVSYHLPVLFVTVLGLWVVFWFGYRLFGEGPALLATLVLALMPQVIGHSQNNLKDTPLMVFFTLSLFLFHEAVRRDRLWLWAVAGVAAGMTYGIKVHAIFLFAIVGLWQLSQARRERRWWLRLSAGMATSLVLALATLLLVWPYYRHGLFARFRETFATFSNHEYNEYVFYLGAHYRAREVPWHFPFVMLGVNTPLVIVVFVLAALGLLVWSVVRSGPGRWPLVLLALWFLMPPVAQVASGAIMMDGIRHYLLVLPAMALLSAYAMWQAGRWVRGRWGSLVGRAYAGAIAAAFAVILWKDVAIHPYEVVFFNRLAGGIRGASSKFELDYWGASLKEAAEWMNRSLPEGSRIWLPMPGQHFFHIDSRKLRFVPGPSRRPNYKVNLIRGLLKTFDTEEDYRYPRRKPVYAVTVDGADLLQIFEYEENRNPRDGTAIAPDSAQLPRGEPGGALQRYLDGDFRERRGEATVSQTLGFDCERNAYAGAQAALRITGALAVPADGLYAFEVQSDDDCVLWMNDVVIIANASGATTRRTLRLSPGSYRLRADYRNDVGPACLRVAWGPDGGPLRTLGAPDLVH
jgi:hypothetical protein